LSLKYSSNIVHDVPHENLRNYRFMDFQDFIQNLNDWFFSRGIKVVAILVVAWIVVRIGKIVISRVINTIIKKSERIVKDGKIQQQRVRTLTKVFKSTFSAIIWVIAVLTVLPELGVNIAPLLAGAGLAGLAIGMGARNLIQDYLSGLFILLEDQYRVGEKIDIGGIKGEVVDLNLRRTVIKDTESTLHYIPNGQVKTASNFSRK
jgi:small-conductance mechanosensitive channel